MKQIKFTSEGFSYEGYPSDAHEFVVDTRRAYETAGMEMRKELNDFLFEIEVRLQKIGYLTEDFEVDDSFEEKAAFPLNLHSGDEFCFENKYYTCLEIEWEGEIAKILAKHIDNGVRQIECHVSEIS